MGWRWPGDWWLGYVVAGRLLAVGLGLLSRLLPIPKSLPMDQFFQDRQGAYLMMIFGVAVAPFAEEMLFRGFLYPVLDRWLQTHVHDAAPDSAGMRLDADHGRMGISRTPASVGLVGGACGFGLSGDGGVVGGAKHEARGSGRRNASCCRALR